jgi:hypothetical protein
VLVVDVPGVETAVGLWTAVGAAAFPQAETRASRTTTGTNRMITPTRVDARPRVRNVGHPIGAWRT